MLIIYPLQESINQKILNHTEMELKWAIHADVQIRLGNFRGELGYRGDISCSMLPNPTWCVLLVRLNFSGDGRSAVPLLRSTVFLSVLFLRVGPRIFLWTSLDSRLLLKRPKIFFFSFDLLSIIIRLKILV